MSGTLLHRAAKFGLTLAAYFLFILCIPAFSRLLHAEEYLADTSGIITEEQVAPSAPEEEKSLLERWFDSFEAARDKTSEHYLGTARSIDSYFSGKPYDEGHNKSQLTIELTNTQYKSGEQENDASIKARLRLPNTTRKLNLVFATEAKEDKTLEERIQGEATGEGIKKDQSIVGLEYIPDTQQSKWKQNFTSGFRLRTSDIFVSRYKIERQWRLKNEWGSNFEQSFSYFNEEGFSAANEINFSKVITDKDTVNIGTTLEFKDEEDTYYYGLVISDGHRLTERSYLQYSTGAYGESQPTNWVTGYFMGITYQKALYKDWLIINAGPQLSFPRDENWKPTPSFTTSLKVYFNE